MVPAAAAAVGARYIEKHLTLKNSDGGLDDPIALTPELFSSMTRSVREIESLSSREDALDSLKKQFGAERINRLLGNGVKTLAPSEAANYGRTNRSVHALHELPPGTLVTTENTALLRSEKKLRPGIRPEFYEEILGKTLSRPVASGEGVTLEDFK
ncbi:MAG TPA: hypothetical protein DCO79_01445 [Spirochaeta sp.]|nr:hypothetical protein [Spirochaeta sp.]